MRFFQQELSNEPTQVSLFLLRKTMFFLILGFCSFSFGKSLNERLGFPREQKLLILNVDDLGNFDSTTRAAQQVFAEGVAKSGSVMTSGPQAQSVTSVLKGRVDLGIHLTLSSEFANRPWSPASSVDQVPSLVDSRGNLQTILNQLLRGSSQEIEKEMEAQILKGFELGMSPSHLDSHMGSAFFKPSWFKSYLKLAKKYRVVPFLPRLAGGTRQLLGFANYFLSPLIQSQLKIAEDAGYLFVDDFYMLPPPADVVSYETRKNQYAEVIRSLEAGVSLIVMHPTFSDFDFRAGVVVNNVSQVFRDHEARILMDPEFQELIRSEGIRLISWKEIADVYPWDDIKQID